jgi:hypothetical protein
MSEKCGTIGLRCLYVTGQMGKRKRALSPPGCRRDTISTTQHRLLPLPPIISRFVIDFALKWRSIFRQSRLYSLTNPCLKLIWAPEVFGESVENIQKCRFFEVNCIPGEESRVFATRRKVPERTLERCKGGASSH